MFRQLVIGVHKTRYDDCLEFAKTKNGILSTIQPDSDKESDFVLVEINFKDCNDMNSFIYSMYMKHGVYFYVDSCVFKSNIF